MRKLKLNIQKNEEQSNSEQSILSISISDEHGYGAVDMFDGALMRMSPTTARKLVERAHLIAAAPEMLEALELAVRRIEDSAEATAYFGVELEQLQETIAKARGES